MKYTYNNYVTLQENLLEIETYGQTNSLNEEEEIRLYLKEIKISKEDTEKLITSYLRGFKQPK